jgi:hypothetical protein
MKTKLNLRLSLSLLSMLLLLNSFAQKNISGESAYRSSVARKTGVTFPLPENNLLITESTNKQVLKHFNKSFKNAENIKWEKLDENFLATFALNGVTTKSLFDTRGKLIYEINYVSEKQLPPSIKNAIIDNYTNYEITSAAGILQNNRQMWIVKLSTETNYVEVLVKDGEMEEIENFRKAN